MSYQHPQDVCMSFICCIVYSCPANRQILLINICTPIYQDQGFSLGLGRVFDTWFVQLGEVSDLSEVQTLVRVMSITASMTSAVRRMASAVS